jgi:hypothetical protein
MERKLEAAIALTMMNLVSDDFGLDNDIDRGLQCLVLAAELGSKEHQACLVALLPCTQHKPTSLLWNSYYETAHTPTSTHRRKDIQWTQKKT